MIHPNELKIGNYLNYYETGEPCRVIEIGQAGIWVDYKEGEDWGEYDKFSPIPLTPEILKQLGFETLGAEIDYIEWGDEENGFSLFNDGGLNDERNRSYYFKNWNNHKETEIKYVHQLQNVYFALTGKDLQYIYKIYKRI